MTKLKILFILFCLFLLAACPAPRFNHVIINESNEILEVEYEYVLPMVKHDSSEITAPAKTTIAEYNDKDAGEVWRNLTAQKDYQIESREEETSVNVYGSNEKRKQTTRVEKVRLALQQGEILRVFVSEHINKAIKNLKRISLKGAKGKLEIEGDGFEQFAEYRTGGFFSGKTDYRIVYK